MTDEIIVPIAAPGGTEAAATMRRFAGTLAEAGAAHDKLTAATVKAEGAVKTEGGATSQSTQVHQHHIRTLQEETLRLKAHEEQLRVTAAARRALGESFNAADIGKMRTFARRSLGGGILGEAGRGVTEGIEGFQGGGLAAGLGMAGAGMAGGFLAFEGFKTIMERIEETFNYELNIRKEMTSRVRDMTSESGKGGASAMSHRDALIKLAAQYGPGSVAQATSAEKNYDDTSAIEALADSNQRFGKGSKAASTAMSLSDLLHRIGAGSMGKIEQGLNPGFINLAMLRGVDQAAADYMTTNGGGGKRYGVNDIHHMLGNLSEDPTAKQLRSLSGIQAQTDAANIGHIPDQEQDMRSTLTTALAPGASALTKWNQDHAKEIQDAQTKQNSWNSLQDYFEGPLWRTAIGDARTVANWSETGPDTGVRKLAEQGGDAADRLMPGLNGIAEAAQNLVNAINAAGAGSDTPNRSPGPMQ